MLSERLEHGQSTKASFVSALTGSAKPFLQFKIYTMSIFTLVSQQKSWIHSQLFRVNLADDAETASDV